MTESTQLKAYSELLIQQIYWSDQWQYWPYKIWTGAGGVCRGSVFSSGAVRPELVVSLSVPSNVTLSCPCLSWARTQTPWLPGPEGRSWHRWCRCRRRGVLLGHWNRVEIDLDEWQDIGYTSDMTEMWKAPGICQIFGETGICLRLPGTENLRGRCSQTLTVITITTVSLKYSVTSICWMLTFYQKIRENLTVPKSNWVQYEELTHSS